MKVSSNQQYNQKFEAKLISQWKCTNGKGSFRNVSILEIEQLDVEYFENFRKNLDKYNHIQQIRQAIIDASSNTISAVLQNMTGVFQKVKMLMAVHDGKPCGLLIANIPKQMPVIDTKVYSTRHNPAKNETEIDWLVTWNPNRNENIKGIGKALVGEYFRTVKKDGFRDVFVRSEIPENSNAVYFYESIGFERISDKRVKLVNKNTGKYLVNNFSEPDDDVIPMIIVKSKIEEKSKELATTMNRREFVKSSIDINELVEN